MFKAVIFDWAGTTVDYGCFAPVQAFMEVFKHFGVERTFREAGADAVIQNLTEIPALLRQVR